MIRALIIALALAACDSGPDAFVEPTPDAGDPQPEPDGPATRATVEELCARGGAAQQARAAECYPNLVVDGWAEDYAAACCSDAECAAPTETIVVDACGAWMRAEPCEDLFSGYWDVPDRCWGKIRPRVTDEAACQAVSWTYCSWASACGTVAEEDLPTCVATVSGVCCSVAGCGSAEPPYIPASMVDACTADLVALSCDTSSDAPPPPSCAELASFVGAEENELSTRDPLTETLTQTYAAR